MRPAVVAIVALIGVGLASASEIREFNIHTTELLGRQLFEQRNQDSKSLPPPERRALEITRAVLKGRIDSTCKFIVLHDPTKGGYLVYALATSKDPNIVVLGIHYRVTVSADGNKIERVDALSRTAVVVPKTEETSAFWMIHLVSTRPVETQVYVTFLYSMALYVGTVDHAIWKIQDGRISKTRAAR